MHDVLRVLEAALGAAIVGFVMSDVFRSVVVPRATRRTLRLGPVMGMVVLRAWLRWAETRLNRRQSTLGALGPLLIVFETVIWVLLLVLGFAMLLQASGGLRPANGFGDALFAAAEVLATTGLSGQEVVGMGRPIAAIAGFSGLGVVTLVVTFLLSIQSALLRREAPVLRLRARIGPEPSGLLVLETLARAGRGQDEVLPGFFEGWEGWAADVLLSHRAYPILVYFRSTDEDCGWLAAAGAVLDAAALSVALGHDAGEHALVCHQMGARLLVDLTRQFGLSVQQGAGLDRPAFDAGVERLRAAGYAVPDATDAVWARFSRLRGRHLPPLAALARRFGEPEARW